MRASCRKAVAVQFASRFRYQSTGPLKPPAEKAATYSLKCASLIHGGRVASSGMVERKVSPSGKKPVDWYRNLDANWAATAFLQDARIRVPAGFVVGERDPVRHYAGAHEAGLQDWAPDLRTQVVVPGAGHWIQQERPGEVNRLLLDFLGQPGVAA